MLSPSVGLNLAWCASVAAIMLVAALVPFVGPVARWLRNSAA